MAVEPPTVNAALIAMFPSVCRVTLPVAALVVVAAETVMPPKLLVSPMTRLPAVMRLSSAFVRPRVRSILVAEGMSTPLAETPVPVPSPMLILALCDSVVIVTLPVP